MTKFVIMEDDFTYAVVDTQADAEELILSMIEDWAYDQYLYDVMSGHSTTEEYFADIKEMMRNYSYETMLCYLYDSFDNIYAVEVPAI